MINDLIYQMGDKAMYTLKDINDKLRNGNFTERNVAMAILADYAEQEEQGLLHIAPIPDGTRIYTLSSEDEVEFFGEEPISETSYLYNHTEYAYGEMNKDWFLTREAAEEALREGVKTDE